MKVTKANGRDKKHRKAKYAMRTSGKSVFILQAIQIKKAGK